jgi:hypothetical protein
VEKSDNCCGFDHCLVTNHLPSVCLDSSVINHWENWQGVIDQLETEWFLVKTLGSVVVCLKNWVRRHQCTVLQIIVICDPLAFLSLKLGRHLEFYWFALMLSSTLWKFCVFFLSVLFVFLNRPRPHCFNCGSEEHQMKECPMVNFSHIKQCLSALNKSLLMYFTHLWHCFLCDFHVAL